MKLLLIAALAITGCKKKREEPKSDPTPVVPVKPAPPVAIPEPPPAPPPRPKDKPLPRSKADATVDQLLVDLRPLLASDYGSVIHNVKAKYVRRDGTLDPKYGELIIHTSTATELNDDPDRPIGAPVPTSKVESAECPEIRFSVGEWTKQNYIRCGDGEAVTTRCTMAQLWDKAIAEAKVPPAALAVIERYQSPDKWFFTIQDVPRKIDIRLSFDDDCTPPKK